MTITKPGHEQYKFNHSIVNFTALYDMLIHLEKIITVTLFGIRFWDSVEDTQITDKLTVTAWPYEKKGPVVKAFRTATGIYAFQGLPGLRNLEYPEMYDSEESDGYSVSPPDTKKFIVRIEDAMGRFLPAVFTVDLPLPYKGVYLNGIIPYEMPGGSAVSSPPEKTTPGLYLFTAPARTALPGIAAVRGQLVDFASRQPAAHAVLEVLIKGKKWYGISDSRGCFAVLFPYPTVNARLNTSPPRLLRSPMNSQQWELNVKVRYNPAAIEQNLPGSNLPDLRGIFKQSYAQIRKDMTGSPPAASTVEELETGLLFGRELILKTEDQPRSVLYIDPQISSP